MIEKKPTVEGTDLHYNIFPSYGTILLYPHHFDLGTFYRNRIHSKLKKSPFQNIQDFYKKFMSLNPKCMLMQCKNILSTWILFIYAEKYRVLLLQQTD